MEQKFFLSQIKRTSGTYEKGIAVKDTLNAARQSFHAYLGAYGYGQATDTDYVAVYIMDMAGNVLDRCVDDRIPMPEPEPEEQTNE